MSLSGPIICPVCGKKAKTGSAIDCARHMFGTGDQPHRKWVDAQVAPRACHSSISSSSRPRRRATKAMCFWEK